MAAKSVADKRIALEMRATSAMENGQALAVDRLEVKNGYLCREYRLVLWLTESGYRVRGFVQGSNLGLGGWTDTGLFCSGVGQTVSYYAYELKDVRAQLLREHGIDLYDLDMWEREPMGGTPIRYETRRLIDVLARQGAAV